MILDPSILVCCDKCMVTEEIPMTAICGGWVRPDIAAKLMELGWLIVSAHTHHCKECSNETPA